MPCLPSLVTCTPYNMHGGAAMQGAMASSARLVQPNATGLPAPSAGSQMPLPTFAPAKRGVCKAFKRFQVRASRLGSLESRPSPPAGTPGAGPQGPAPTGLPKCSPSSAKLEAVPGHAPRMTHTRRSSQGLPGAQLAQRDVEAVQRARELYVGRQARAAASAQPPSHDLDQK